MILLVFRMDKQRLKPLCQMPELTCLFSRCPGKTLATPIEDCIVTIVVVVVTGVWQPPYSGMMC